MKKSLRNSILLLLTAMLLTVSALADSGPKAQLTVKVENAPSEPYYLDLLEKGDYQGHTYGSGDGDDTYSGIDWSYSEEEIAALDDELLDALRAAVPEGWHACTAQGDKRRADVGRPDRQRRRRGAAPLLPLPWRTGYISDHSRDKKRRKLGIRSPTPGNAAIQRDGGLGGENGLQRRRR